MQLNLLAPQLAGNIANRQSTNYEQTEDLRREAKTSALGKLQFCYNL
ncbi:MULTISPECIES: hypothetical protein [unclassified Microcoleus]